MEKQTWPQFIRRMAKRGYSNDKTIKSSVDPTTGKRTGGNFSQRWANTTSQQAISKGYRPDQYKGGNVLGYDDDIKISAEQLARRKNFGPGPLRYPRAVAGGGGGGAAAADGGGDDEEMTGDFYGLGEDIPDSSSPVSVSPPDSSDISGVEPDDSADISGVEPDDSADISGVQSPMGGEAPLQQARRLATQEINARIAHRLQGVGGGEAPPMGGEAPLQRARRLATQEINARIAHRLQGVGRQARQPQTAGQHGGLPPCCQGAYNRAFEGRPSYPCPAKACENGVMGPVKADGCVFMVITDKSGVKRWQRYGSIETAMQAKRKFGYL